MLALFSLLAINFNDIWQKVLDFLLTELTITEGVVLNYWHLVVAAVVVVILIIVIACCAASASKKKKKKNSEEVVDTTDENTEEIISANAENHVSKYENVVSSEQVASEEVVAEETTPEEPVSEPVQEEVAVEEVEEVKEEPVVEEVQPEPVVEVKEEPAQEVAAVEEVKEEAPVAVKKESAVVRKKAPARKPAQKREPVVEVKEEPVVEEKEPVVIYRGNSFNVTGKIEICNDNLGGYNYILKANNGQLLYESKAYKTKEGCTEAIGKFIEAVAQGRFTVRADKFKNYKFILKSPTSNTLLYVGESFSTESSCLNNIESVKRFALNSPVFDVTEDDFVAEFEVYEINPDVVSAVERGEGAVGKWEISQVKEGSKNSPYVYLLYANNGQLLYESRDYKTYASCKNGLVTFVNTVKTGKFIIDPDKTGRYKFVLRSKSANSSSEYIGQSYSTKQACAHSIESVYRFALRSSYEEL